MNNGSIDMIKGIFARVLGILTLTACASFCLSGLAYASGMELQWVAVYNETENFLSDQSVATHEIEVDKSGNTYAGGTFYNHYFLVKYDPEGNEEWVKKYKSADASTHEESIRVRLDSLGNAYLVVLSDSLWEIMKHDPDGNLLWSRSFDETGQARIMWSPFIAGIDGDDNLYVAGPVFPYDYILRYAIAKYDPDGNQIWSVVRRANGYLAIPTALAFDGSGNVYVSGGGVVKYDSGGSLLWAVQFGDGGAAARELAVDGSGDILVSGYKYNSAESYQRVLSKYDPDGALIWSSVDETRTQYSNGAYLAVDRSGGVVTVDVAPKNICQYCHGGFTGKSYVSKYDPDGNLLWRQELEEGVRKGIASLNLDDKGNIFLSGQVSYTINDRTKVKYLNLKFSPDGELLWRDVLDFTYLNVYYEWNILMDAELDDSGNLYATGFSSSRNAAFTVKYASANHRPTANAGSDLTVECAGPDGTQVTLDGSGSTDPDGDVLTYTWAWDGGSAEGVSPSVTLPYGTTAITLTVSDGEYEDSDEVNITILDTTPPSTSAILEGEFGNNGWYVSDVDVELIATDSCTGVRDVHHTITGPGHDGSETVVPGGSADFTLGADGTYTVTYWSVDNAGNVEVIKTPEEVKREASPPAVTPVLPPLPPSGYYAECVIVKLNTTDSVSGGAATEYKDPVTGEWLPYEETVGIPVCGSTTIGYRTTSPAGNVYYNTIDINIDKTPPVITITGVQDGATYELGSVPVASYSVTDATSGVATSSDRLTGGDGLGLGTFTYKVTAKDKAGNEASASVTYEVIATPGSTISVINDLVGSGQMDPEVAGSLLPKLEGAQSANTGTAADGKLQAFINQVNAQVGKKITPEAAAILINAAIWMMNNN